MNRRDFLFFKRAGDLRVAELSCERLYMRAIDTQLVSGSATVDERWDGEPAPVVAVGTIEQLFANLERELGGVDVVRVAGESWLASSQLKLRLDGVLHSFSARGGRVERVAQARSV